MPELPEVEVVRLYLEPVLVGSSITHLEILTPKSFVGDSELIRDQRVTSLSRLGKQLSVHFQNGYTALFHLKMTGQLILVPPGAPRQIMGHPTKNMATQSLPNKSTRLVFTFNPGTTLYFNDQRKFGWVRLLTASELASSQSGLGKDVFDPALTPAYFYRQLQRSSRPLKTVLLDQSFIAGVGNIYANDALFLAGLHPALPASSIPPLAAKKLLTALLQIMRQSVLAGGSTARDNTYLRPDGTPGQNQFHFQVYQRALKPCLVCSTPIVRLSLGGRGTFFCPHCQPL